MRRALASDLDAFAARDERDEARAQLAAADTGAPCDGHRHCCADRRKLAEELLRVRAAEADAAARLEAAAAALLDAAAAP
jgi:hypothetical protein